ncbi:hypothetical protein ACWFPY_09270 [Nocardia fluminea]
MTAVVDSTTFATNQPMLTAADGLTLRPWTDADAPSIYEAFQDPARHPAWSRPPQ